MNKFFVVMLVAVFTMTSWTSTKAQDFPLRTVRIIAPYPPGGTANLVGRLLSDKLQQMWGQTVLVENRPGAGGTIGATLVAKSLPDGYTLVLIDSGPIVVAPHNSQVTMNFDPLKDLVPVAEVIQLAPVIAVRNGLGINDSSDLLTMIKAKPNGLNNALTAQGGFGHVVSSALAKAAGGTMNDVPYQGAGPAVLDFMAGRVDVMVGVALNVVAQHEAQGNFRIIAALTENRIDLRPNIPTVKEVLPSFAISAWFGLFAPAGTPEVVIEKISRDVATVIATQAFEEFRTRNLMLKAQTFNRRDFVSKVRADYEIWSRLVRESGISSK